MKKSTFAVNVLAISFIATFISQVGHECTHGILATLVGAKWTQLNLFFSEHLWPGETNLTGQGIIAGGAAIFNIIVAIICASLFRNKSIASNGTLRLLLFYLTAYNLFAGFGYLFTDPLFYQPGGKNIGDWKRIVDMLGGGWGVRIVISLIGAGGVLWGFFWVARNAHAFIPSEKPERFQFALLMLLLPYIALNILFSIFAFTGPLPAEIIPTSLFAIWFTDFGVGWGAFMSGLWIQAPAGLERSELPNSIQWGWAAGSVILLLIAAFVLLPTLQLA